MAAYPPAEVVDLVARLDRSDPDIRWVPEHLWHVTLRFLGDHVDVDRIDAALRSSFRHEPVVATLGPSVDHFAGQVVHVPVRGLRSVADAVDRALDPVAPPRPRAFVGHLTLGRARRSAPGLSLLGRPMAASFTVDAIGLVRSELSPAGARHEQVATYPLSGSG